MSAMWVAKVPYLEEFSHLNMMRETRQFYKRFFSLTLSDEQVEDILHDEGMRLSKGNVE